MNEIIDFVNSCGFPIFSFLLASYFIKYSFDKSNEQNDKAMEKIGTLAEAVNHNSEVLTNLVEEMRKDNE